MSSPEKPTASAVGQVTEYAHGAYEDCLNWETGYATREDAIADGETEHEEHFVTGRVVHPKASQYLSIDLSNLFDGVSDNIISHEGEWADAYERKFRALAAGDGAQADTLMKHLRAAFDEWAEANGMTPDFYRVVDMEYHDAKSEEEPHE